MSRSVSPRPFVLAGLALILIANAVLFGGRLTAWVSDNTGGMLSPVSGAFARMRALISVAVGRNDLASENLRLNGELLRLQSLLANQDELQRDLQFYRSASGMRDRTGKDPIRAGIFSYPQAGGVRQVVLNRGRADWVEAGDVVVTPSGALIGAVSQLFEHHAVVTMIGDIGLDVTVRVVGTEVSGLLHTTPNGGVIMDLVQKNEEVSEGAVITTSGDDWYPAGLIVGTVRSVDNDAATLFKIVRIAPAIAENPSGDVIVIRP